MVKNRRRQAQQMIEIQLAGGRVQQVSAPHHLRHAHGGIIHHHSQLVGEHPVGPPQQKIPAVCRQIFLVSAHVAVCKAPTLLRRYQPEGRGAISAFFRDLRRGETAAGPGIDHLPVLPVRSGGSVNLRPGTEAGINKALFPQRFQCRLVDLRPLALVIGAGAVVPSGADVPIQPQPLEIPLHLLAVPPGTAGGIQILHPKQDPAVLLSGGEPHQQGAQKISQMQPPAGGRRETPNALHGPSFRVNNPSLKLWCHYTPFLLSRQVFPGNTDTTAGKNEISS